MVYSGGKMRNGNLAAFSILQTINTGRVTRANKQDDREIFDARRTSLRLVDKKLTSVACTFSH